MSQDGLAFQGLFTPPPSPDATLIGSKVAGFQIWLCHHLQHTRPPRGYACGVIFNQKLQLMLKQWALLPSLSSALGCTEAGTQGTPLPPTGHAWVWAGAKNCWPKRGRSQHKPVQGLKARSHGCSTGTWLRTPETQEMQKPGFTQAVLCFTWAISSQLRGISTHGVTTSSHILRGEVLRFVGRTKPLSCIPRLLPLSSQPRFLVIKNKKSTHLLPKHF